MSRYVEVIKEAVRIAFVGHTWSKSMWKAIMWVGTFVGIPTVEAISLEGTVSLVFLNEERHFPLWVVCMICTAIVILATSFTIAWYTVPDLEISFPTYTLPFATNAYVLVKNTSTVKSVERLSVKFVQCELPAVELPRKGEENGLSPGDTAEFQFIQATNADGKILWSIFGVGQLFDPQDFFADLIICAKDSPPKTKRIEIKNGSDNRPAIREVNPL